jgi:chaperone required for assembly of F1-ATPase
MKKFYSSVDISPCQTSIPDAYKDFSCFSLLLDGKTVQTPLRQPLILICETIADKVRQEWLAQQVEVKPETMPITQLSMTLQDRVVPYREKLTDEIMGYIHTDLLCYRASEPEDFRLLQHEIWTPFIGYINTKFSYEPITTTGLHHIQQDINFVKTIHDYIQNLDIVSFMAVYLTTIGTGSLMIALAFYDMRFQPDEVMRAVFVEEHYKDKIYMAEKYGAAPDQERREKNLRDELETIKAFLQAK